MWWPPIVALLSFRAVDGGAADGGAAAVVMLASDFMYDADEEVPFLRDEAGLASGLADSVELLAG